MTDLEISLLAQSVIEEFPTINSAVPFREVKGFVRAILAAQLAAPVAAQGERHLRWTAELPPNEHCSYDHVTASTPFGPILITWKGWKDYPSPTVDEHPIPDFFYVGNDVEDAKAQAEKAYFNAIDVALKAAPQGASK